MTLVSRIYFFAKTPMRDAPIADVHFRDPLFPHFTHGPFRGVQRAVLYIGDVLLGGGRDTRDSCRTVGCREGGHAKNVGSFAA